MAQSQQRLAERDEQNKGLASELVYSRNELELRSARIQRIEVQTQQLQSKLEQSESAVDDLGQQIKVSEQTLAAEQGLISLRNTQLTALLQDLAQKDAELSIRETEVQRAAAALEEQKRDLLNLDTRLSEALRQLSTTQAGVHERNGVIARLTKTAEDREYRLREIEACLTDAQTELTSLRTSLRDRDLQNSNTLTAMAEKVRVLRAELARFADAEQQRALQLEQNIKIRFPAEEINTLPVDAVIQSVNENVEVGVESVQMSMRAAYGNVVAIGDHTSVMATGAGAGTDEQTTLRRPLLVASNNTPGRSEAVAVQTEIDRARAELARAGANYAKNEAGSVASLRLLDKQAAELEKLRCEKEEESKRLAAVSERARERELEAASLAQQIAERESKIACLDKSIAERDSQLAELTDETVRRGIWALGLDQQLKETQAKIAQITSSNSWKATLPLREMRRWVVAPTSQAKRYFTSSAKLAKSVYTRLPISRQTKVAHRHLLSKHAPWALRAAGSYPLAIPALHVPTAAARSAENPIVGRTNISLARSAQPIVSVIIPIYGKCEYTLRCLTSIAANLPSAPFEVIVVDDCSPDNSAEILGEVHGIRLISSAQNQGFIRSCNVGAKAANGQYLYFLNNDTEVTAGWLDELLRTFHEFPGTGLVGSKLMYPNGTLQEAGGIIWQDGSAWNFGRNQDPALPVYNYAREVDYCSGASIMTPKELFESLNGFDEHYLPAYCEDSDLALKIRDHGHRVICQPRSVVVHYEGVTSGTDTTQGTKAYQIENSKKLFERWKDRLHHHQANGINVDSAKDRTAKRRVLVLDHCTPTPNQDAGSVTVFNLLLLLREMDFQVTFIPEDNFLYMPDYTPALQRVGIEVLYAPYYTSIEQHLKEAGERYDLAFLFRPGVVERHLQAIRKHCAKAKVLFHTVDLHFLRMSREAQLQSDVAKQKAADEMKQRELTAIRASDASIVHSTAEFELLRPEVPDAKLHVFPLIMDVVGSGKEFSERKDIVFIGGYQHTPNVDAVKYFVAEIMPLIRRRLPGVHFYAVGSKPPTDIQTLACEDVIITGFVENLAPLLDKMRVSVAPLRYGAGIKGKIGSAMAVGLPVVATPLAAEGMSLSDGENILVASGAEQFADAVVSLYKNESLWDRISHRGLQFAENAWGAEAAWKTLSLILAGLDIATHRRAHPLSLFSSLDVAKKKEKQLSVKLTPVASLQNREEFCLAWKNESLAHIRQIEKSLIESSGNEAFSVDGYCAPCNMQVSFIVDKRSAVQLHEHDWLPNWRERLECPQCRMNSRQRLMATLIKQTLQVKGKKSVYFMEQVTPIYAWATSTFKNHRIVGSEYLGHEFEGGAVIKGLRHEDVEHLSFTEGALDLIVSNDVFEHVPNPARAFSECVRVLRPGGIMLATIPFHHVADTSEARATLSSKGIEHLLPPMYHGNPVSADGSLVFTDFGWDILGNLRKAGFSNACVEIYASAEHGILGGGQIVFVATKEA